MDNGYKVLALGSQDFFYSFLTYGIDAILVIFLTKFTNNSEYSALEFLGIKGCVIYSLPILLTILSNKYITEELLCCLGLVVMSAGLTVIDSTNADQLALSLSLVTVGYAVGRPMIPIILGKLVAQHENIKLTRLYYLFSNLALLIAPIVFSLTLISDNKFLFKKLGLFSMLCGLIFIVSYKKDILQKIVYLLLGLFQITVIVWTVYYLIKYPSWLKLVFGLSVIVMVIELVKIFSKSDLIHRQNIWQFTVLIISGIVFFIFFTQQFFFMPLFIDKYITCSIYNFTIPTPWFTIINPLSGIIIAPTLNKYFANISMRVSVLMALVSISLSFLSLLVGINYISSILVSVFIYYVFISLGEIMLVPMILSRISTWPLQSQKKKLTGFLYLSMAFSKIFAPHITQYIGFPKDTSILSLKNYYTSKFLLISLACAFLAFVVQLILKKIAAINNDLVIQKTY